MLGEVYHAGQLYCREERDWTDRQAVGKTRADTANQRRPPDPGLGEGERGGSCLSKDEGVAILNSQPSATEEDRG